MAAARTSWKSARTCGRASAWCAAVRGPHSWAIPIRSRARIDEYRQIGIDTFIFSGYPHLEEAHRFGELVLPNLPLNHPVKSHKASANTGPFGETIAGDHRPFRSRFRSPERTKGGLEDLSALERINRNIQPLTRAVAIQQPLPKSG